MSEDEATTISITVEPQGDVDATEAAEQLQQIYSELREAGLDVEQIEGASPEGAKGGAIMELVLGATRENVIHLGISTLFVTAERFHARGKITALVHRGHKVKRVDIQPGVMSLAETQAQAQIS